MTTINDLPIPGASPVGIDLGAFLLSHGSRCAPTVGYRRKLCTILAHTRLFNFLQALITFYVKKNAFYRKRAQFCLVLQLTFRPNPSRSDCISRHNFFRNEKNVKKNAFIRSQFFFEVIIYRGRGCNLLLYEV